MIPQTCNSSLWVVAAVPGLLTVYSSSTLAWSCIARSLTGATRAIMTDSVSMVYGTLCAWPPLRMPTAITACRAVKPFRDDGFRAPAVRGNWSGLRGLSLVCVQPELEHEFLLVQLSGACLSGSGEDLVPLAVCPTRR